MPVPLNPVVYHGDRASLTQLDRGGFSYNTNNETNVKQIDVVKLKVVTFQVDKEKEEYLGSSIVGSVKDADYSIPSETYVK
nr:hypothetical protein [Tanacetum cinerariifolium]